MVTARTPADYALIFEDPPEPRRHAGGRPGPKSPRVPRPHFVAPESHRPHGTYAKYVVERCTCEPCRAAAREYAQDRSRAMARPDQAWVPYVPAGRARRHLAELAAAGVGLKTVTKLGRRLPRHPEQARLRRAGPGRPPVEADPAGAEARSSPPLDRIARQLAEILVVIRPARARQDVDASGPSATLSASSGVGGGGMSTRPNAKAGGRNGERTTGPGTSLQAARLEELFKEGTDA